ncbi:hypothetical protein M4I33_16440 [Clostridium sp. LY3-2]|uniref:hypothetical protein n=1 Tax=Clostridium sp. LY3-2 TaxID=2942482 RepID=UPI002152F175|nr:hypothetical protein [Clostridium sp. LY3-2]MCR6516446.1 hypothetical protein [Clostridium sp. LY3-2]
MDLIDRLNKYRIYEKAWEQYNQEGHTGRAKTELVYEYAETITSNLWRETRDELRELSGQSWIVEELNFEERALLDKMKELKMLGELCKKKSIDEYNNR